MHLVRVRHLFYPDLPKDYFFELCQRQSSLGYELDLVTWNKHSRNLAEELTAGFRVWRLPGLNLAFGGGVTDFPYMPGLQKMVSSLGPEIVHAESHLFLSTAQAVNAANELGVPCVVTVHGVTARRNTLVNFAQVAYLRTFGRRVFSRASRVICLTETDADEITAFGCPIAKISVVPNGVDLETFKPGTNPREDLVVWTGRFVPEKGLPDILKAAKIVTTSLPQAQFLLVGFGPERRKLERLARDLRLPPEQVRFAGPVSRFEIAKILRRAAIFAFPSLKEGLPISILEAMASGLPVAGYDIPALQQLIVEGEEGLLANPGDFAQLASNIEALLRDGSLRTRLGEQARKKAVEGYSLSFILGKLDEIYRQAREGAR